MICVVATIEVAEGRRAELLAEFHKVVPQVLEEEGCIEYGLMVDVPTNIGAQPAIRENAVVVLEKWESTETLERHLKAPHMAEYRERVKGLVVGTLLHVLQPA